MLGNISIGQYIDGESILHRLDPRTKILATILLMVVIFLMKHILSYVGFALVILFIMLISKIPIRYAIKGLKPILFLIIFTVVINMFTIKGTVVVDFWIFEISKEGIILAIRLAFRLILLVVSASLLTLTTTPIRLTDGIEKLMKPLSKLGFPAHEIALMMTIALRFIPTLIEETDKIMKAQKSRGANFETGSLIQRAKNFLPILVPLFVNSFKRADDLAIAMEARGYKGAKGRTKLYVLSFTKDDLMFSFVFIILSICAIIADYIIL